MNKPFITYKEENEQLRDKVRELEEFKENVVKECASIIKHAHKDIAKQLAESQAYAEQLREACAIAEKTIDIVWVSHHANRCDHTLELCRKALSQPTSTEALDAYVAEQREVAYREARKAADQLEAGLTRQRDLAVEALDNLVKQKGRHNTEVAYKRLVEALEAIKESEKP